MLKLRIERSVRFSAMWGGGKKRSDLAALALAALCVFFSATQGFAHPKTSPELRHSNSGKAVDVIVQFTTAPTDRHIAKVTGKGAGLKKKLSVINGAAFRQLPASAVARLAEDPDVAYISVDRTVKGSGLDYAPETVNAPWAWQTLQQFSQESSGVGVVVIDSGISPVADLYWYNTQNAAYGLRVVYSQNFVDGPDASDYYGHGTHVAGIIAGAGWSSFGNRYSHTFRGIAPNTNVINLRALDQNGIGSDSSVIAAIQTAINLKEQYNIRVINLSLGRQVYESYTLDPLCQAVEAAWRAGIVVVAAAGNEGRNDDFSTEGYGTIAAPGNDPYVITVGAMKTAGTPSRGDDTVASYSSKGPTAFDHVVKPDLVAPGNQVVSLLAAASELAKKNGSSVNVYTSEYITKIKNSTPSSAYMRLSGTSMAAPMVAGTAALMIEADPSLTPDTVKARLMKSATKEFPTVSTTVTDPTTGESYNSYYDMFTVGAGYLDVQGALLSTDVVPVELTAKSPAAAYDAASGNVYMTSDASVLWGSSVIWGSSVVWGSAVFAGATVDGQSVLWGDSVIWGASKEDGFSVIWGSSVLWGSTTKSDSMSVLTKGEN